MREKKNRRGEEGGKRRSYKMEKRKFQILFKLNLTKKFFEALKYLRNGNGQSCHSLILRNTRVTFIFHVLVNVLL